MWFEKQPEVQTLFPKKLESFLWRKKKIFLICLNFYLAKKQRYRLSGLKDQLQCFQKI